MLKEIKIPDLGGATDVDVIDVRVKPGDEVKMEDSLVTLESEKASMDVPSPFAGKIKEVKVKVGDKVKEQTLIATIEVAEEEKGKEKSPEEKVEKTAEAPTEPVEKEKAKEIKPEVEVSEKGIHAGPAVRRLARELEVDLAQVRGTGERGRITKDDLKAFLTSQGAGVGISVAPMPKIDFSRFGETEIKPLNKIKRLTGVNVHRSWVTIPHVTQFEEADVTEMENFRQAQKAEAEKKGLRLTPLVFLMKAVVAALKTFPQFNASLDEKSENLILKKYFHIGVAVDTPNGLVVPVIRDVDKKGIYQLAKELGDISAKAREKGLTPAEMQGGCFTISSLGGIGGTAFTPIVNSPEVAILGVSKSEMKPVYQNGEFKPRLMLPLSLSYDHRVIDGADGARFAQYLCWMLSDVRRLLL